MKLSPLEIKKQEFARAFRGYDAEEVQAFLQMMSSQWETLLEENRRLEEQVRDYKNKIEHYEKVEEALQDALETARESAKEKVANAEQRAENMIEEAEQKAERITGEAQQDRYAMKQEVSKLKHRREEIVARLRAFLMSEMEMLAQYEEDDPIGFIKFLPQQGSEEGGEDMPTRGRLQKVPRPQELAEDSETPLEEDVKTEKEGKTGDVGRPEPSPEEAASASDRSSTGRPATEAPSPTDRADSSKDEEESSSEKKRRWRVHSVVSSPPDSKDSPQTTAEEQETAASSAEASSDRPADRQQSEQQQDAGSSEEMDKIRRILDDLE